MLQNYFRLQWKRLYRISDETTKYTFLAVVFALVVFVFLSYSLFEKTSLAAYIYALLALMAVHNLSDLPRNDFLKALYPRRTYYTIRILENLLLSLPFAPYLIFKGFYLLAAGLQLVSVLLALFSFRRPFDIALPTPFFRYPFEFITGFRRSWLLPGLAYTLTIIAVKYHNFNLGVFSLIVVLLDCIGIVLLPEQYYFVWVFAMDARTFLYHKIKAAVVCTFILCLPTLVTLWVFYPGNITTAIGFEVWGIILVVMAMLSKYTAYPDDISTQKGVLLAIALFFPVLVLYTLPAFYIEARKQLRMILE